MSDSLLRPDDLIRHDHGHDDPPPPLKVVLLIAGQPYEDLALIHDPVQDDYVLEAKPAGFQGVSGIDWYPADPLFTAAWNAIYARYTDALFQQAGWITIPLWPSAHSKQGCKEKIFSALADIAAMHPTALVVHYLGHGDEDASGPCLEIAPTVTNPAYAGNPPPPPPHGPYRIQRPDIGGRRCVCSVESVADEIKKLFPDPSPTQPLPKTLIVDGCDCAPSIENRDWDNHFYMITACDIPHQESIFVAFSRIFGQSKAVAPALFETTFPTLMPAVLGVVNPLLAAEGLAHVDAIITLGFQVKAAYSIQQQATIDVLRPQ